MSDQPAASPAPPPVAKRNSLQTPVRIILFAVLAILIVGFAFDRKARSSASAAFDLLDGKLSPEHQGTVVKRGEVPQLIGREPEKDDNPGDEYEIYSWPGTLRSQILYVQYLPGDDGTLAEVSLNNPLPGFAQ
jgi:hypothetical protein